MTDDIRTALNGGWRKVEDINFSLATGKIDETGWYAAMEALCIPKYLAANNPRAQSGHSGDQDEWERARSLLLDGINRDGTLLDIGCANGHLMETCQLWARERGLRIEPFGLDISRDIVGLAVRRLPHWKDRFWVANALEWEPPRRFDFVHLQNIDYVPEGRRRDLVLHLLTRVCAPNGRLIVGPFNELKSGPALENTFRNWGFEVAGQGQPAHRHPEVEYRAFWVDAQ